MSCSGLVTRMTAQMLSVYQEMRTTIFLWRLRRLAGKYMTAEGVEDLVRFARHWRRLEAVA